MNRLEKSQEIIERIEYIRNYLRLNKSRFSAEIGLKPQTYNNFIGSQGSKPSVELILGTVNRFGANPNWILNGKGPVFQEWTAEREQRTRGAPDMGAWVSQLSEPGLGEPSQDLVRADVISKLTSLEEKVREAERRLDVIEGRRFPAIREIASLLMRLFDADPAKAEQTSHEWIANLRRWLGERTEKD